MPWKIQSVIGGRERLINVLLWEKKSVAEASRQFGVSRKTVYKWKVRFRRDGRAGLRDRSRRPHRLARRVAGRWRNRIERWHRRHPRWGPKKIRACLRGQGLRPPSLRTLARWFQRWGWSRPRRQRPRRACVRRHPALTEARRPNQVWTVDFKGWFRAGNGQRCEPLTVRDLFSRYGLRARLLGTQHGRQVQAVFTGLFQQFGLPEGIRIDNGSPFASRGPAGLSRLSVWWVRLGIRVEFTRPACPQDNGAHEQFHGVMKRETTQPPAATRQGQQHRTTCWLHAYNEQRPHEALGQTVPARWYRQSRRKLPARLPALKYGPKLTVRHVRSNGEIRWAGRKRFIGEAFVAQPIGLRVLKPGILAVYFANILIGHLHEKDSGAMRPARYEHRRTGHKKKKV